MLDELFAAPSTREIAPVILDLFLPNQEGPFKCCFDEFHKQILQADAFIALHTSTFKGTSCINKHWSGMAAPQKRRNLTELRPRGHHDKGIDIEQRCRQTLAVSDTCLAHDAARPSIATGSKAFSTAPRLSSSRKMGKPDSRHVGSRSEG